MAQLWMNLMKVKLQIEYHLYDVLTQESSNNSCSSNNSYKVVVEAVAVKVLVDNKKMCEYF